MMPDDASEEEIRKHCMWVCVEIHWNIIRGGEEEEINTLSHTQPNIYKANPQETEDRFDCFMQLFQHLMDLHWDFNQRNWMETQKKDKAEEAEEEKGRNVLNTCHWNFNSFRVQLRFSE